MNRTFNLLIKSLGGLGIELPGLVRSIQQLASANLDRLIPGQWTEYFDLAEIQRRQCFAGIEITAVCHKQSRWIFLCFSLVEYLLTVRSARKLVGVLLLGVLFGYPVMACLVPDAEMTEAERACCKHMAQQCGSMNMPSSHSCCQKEVSRPNSMLGATFAQLVAPALSGAMIAELPQPMVVGTEFSSFELHSPPESPPGTSSILRI